MKKLYSWDRKFQLWHYSVSHSTLLLRSVHPQRYDTRVDILFSAVSFMHVRPSYEPLTLSEGDDRDRQTLQLASAPVEAGENALYLLNGGEGYIYASSCSWHEDYGDHRSPSEFGPLRGTN
jgi:hypothetical protein